MSIEKPKMTLVLVEPQACFASALAGLFQQYSSEVDVGVFGSLGEADGACVDADVVLVDLDPSLMDPVAAAHEVSQRGGRATIAMSAREFQLAGREAPSGLLGIIGKKLPPRDFVDAVMRAARRETRIGVLPDDWSDRRLTGGALAFVGWDRRGRLAAS